MNMINKCAKFHKDSPSDKKVKFNLPSANELSERADFVYNFVQKRKRATLVAHLTNVSFEFFYQIFTKDASQLLLYHGAKKSKWPKPDHAGQSRKFKKSRILLKEKFVLLVDFEFWRKRALGASTNRFPLIWEKSSKRQNPKAALCCCEDFWRSLPHMKVRYSSHIEFTHMHQMWTLMCACVSRYSVIFCALFARAKKNGDCSRKCRGH